MAQLFCAKGEAVPEDKLVVSIGELASTLDCIITNSSTDSGTWHAKMLTPDRKGLGGLQPVFVQKESSDELLPVSADADTFEGAFAALAITISEGRIAVPRGDELVAYDLPVVLPGARSIAELDERTAHNAAARQRATEAEGRSQRTAE